MRVLRWLAVGGIAGGVGIGAYLLYKRAREIIPPAGKGNIWVKVVDSTTNAPVAGAAVVLDGVGRYTDAEGVAKFLDLEPRAYTITASKTGYQDFRGAATAVAGKTLVVTVSLVPAAAPPGPPTPPAVPKHVLKVLTYGYCQFGSDLYTVEKYATINRLQTGVSVSVYLAGSLVDFKTTVEGAATFTLDEGTYRVVAEYGGVRLEQDVTLDRDKEIRFDFPSTILFPKVVANPEVMVSMTNYKFTPMYVPVPGKTTFVDYAHSIRDYLVVDDTRLFHIEVWESDSETRTSPGIGDLIYDCHTIYYYARYQFPLPYWYGKAFCTKKDFEVTHSGGTKQGVMTDSYNSACKHYYAITDVQKAAVVVNEEWARLPVKIRVKGDKKYLYLSLMYGTARDTIRLPIAR